MSNSKQRFAVGATFLLTIAMLTFFAQTGDSRERMIARQQKAKAEFLARQAAVEKEAVYPAKIASRLEIATQLNVGPGMYSPIPNDLLRDLHGETAQVLRLLFWGLTFDPEFRKELLLEWLTEKKGDIAESTAQAQLMSLVPGRTAESLAARSAEIQEVFHRLPSERGKRQKTAASPPTTQSTSYPLLDKLTESILLGDRQARDAFLHPLYAKLPIPSESDDHAADGLFLLLWCAEADDDAAVDLEKQIVSGCSGLGPDPERLLSEFEPAERDKRLARIPKVREELRHRPQPAPAPRTYTLTLKPDPDTQHGIVKVDGVERDLPYTQTFNTDAAYDPGLSVKLEPLGWSGWRFDSWSGDLDGNAVPADVPLAKDKTVVVRFVPAKVDHYTLTVNTAGMGQVLVDGKPVTASTWSRTYPIAMPPTEVELVAKASEGASFLGWTGGVESNEVHQKFRLTGDTMVNAVFGTAEASAGDVIISEIMPGNEPPDPMQNPELLDFVVDEDGDYSDWVELWNKGDRPVCLAGWKLVYGRGTEWTFPPVTLKPNGYLVVWASGKNRVNPQKELHTNFTLADEGAYLALRDGTPAHAVATEFPDGYPEVPKGWSYSIGHEPDGQGSKDSPDPITSPGQPGENVISK